MFIPETCPLIPYFLHVRSSPSAVQLLHQEVWGVQVYSLLFHAFLWFRWFIAIARYQARHHPLPLRNLHLSSLESLDSGEIRVPRPCYAQWTTPWRFQCVLIFDVKLDCYKLTNIEEMQQHDFVNIETSENKFTPIDCCSTLPFVRHAKLWEVSLHLITESSPKHFMSFYFINGEGRTIFCRVWSRWRHPL